jgi:hypothetical protein
MRTVKAVGSIVILSYFLSEMKCSGKGYICSGEVAS